jgi:outer membrane lipoprotein-sorting protein
MNDSMRFHIVDDDLPFEADLAELFQQSVLPRRLEIDQLVDGCEPPARIRDAVHDARPRRLVRWLAVATLAVCAGLVIGLAGIFFPPKSALAQVAAQLQRASSLRCSVMTTGLNRVMHGTLYWAAPGSYREEQVNKGEVVSVDIQPANQPGLHIFHWPIKTFRKLPPDHRQPPLPIMILEKLATLRGKADRDLGRSMIGNVEAQGFEIALRQLNPEAGAADKLRVWYNPKTMRPLRIEAELFSFFGVVRIGDFVWDEPSDKWFDTTPPAGYEERKLEMPPTAETVNALVKAFRIYAKYCGGRYPDGDMVQTEIVNAELYYKTGMVWAKLTPPKKGGMAPGKKGPPEFSENVKDYWSAQNGFAEINLLRQFPVDPAYHGKTVGPNDREKVLLRWKLTSGDYQVIYGDLRSESVSAQRLKELESR